MQICGSILKWSCLGSKSLRGKSRANDLSGAMEKRKQRQRPFIATIWVRWDAICGLVPRLRMRRRRRRRRRQSCCCSGVSADDGNVCVVVSASKKTSMSRSNVYGNTLPCNVRNVSSRLRSALSVVKAFVMILS